MGEIAFSRNAGQDRLRDQQWHAAMTALQKGMALLGPLSPVPWLLHIGLSLPFIPIVRDWNSMVAFCKSCIDDRIKVDNLSSGTICDPRMALEMTKCVPVDQLEETDHDVCRSLLMVSASNQKYRYRQG